MDTSLMLVIAFAATLIGGMAIGFMMGMTKGMALGATFRTGRPVSPIPWISCMMVSVAFFITSVGSSIYSMYFIRHGLSAEARITEIVEHKDSEGRVSRNPVYTYRDFSGKDHTDRSSMSGDREFKVGDIIPIRYLKDSPHQSRIDYFMHHWFIPIFFSLASLVSGGLGYGLRWWRRREQKWANNQLASCATMRPGQQDTPHNR